MATVTSNGSGGGAWSTGSTWVGGMAPSTSDDVVIANGDTITLDANVNMATLIIGVGSTLTETVPHTYTFDVDSGIFCESGATVTGIDFVSVAVGSGYFQIQPSGAATAVTLEDCDFAIPVTLYTAYANPVSLANSTLQSFSIALATGGTVTGGSIQTLDDSGCVGTSTVTLDSVTVETQMTGGTSYVTATMIDCTIAALVIGQITVDATDCSILGLTTAGGQVLSTFTTCTIANANLVISGSIPDNVVTFNNCELTDCQFAGYDYSDTLRLNVAGTSTLLNGVTVQGYAILNVTERLPDAAWADVTAEANAYFWGYILASAIEVTLVSNIVWGSSGAIGVTDEFVVKSALVLTDPVFAGGAWQLYATLSCLGTISYLAQTNFNIQTKSAQIGMGDPGGIISYAGVSGVSTFHVGL